VVLFEAFGGLHGARLALEACPVVVVADFYSEIDASLRAIAGERWPHAVDVGDVTKITEDDVQGWCKDLPGEVDLIILAGGFPCKDTSRLKAGRMNLKGDQSSLIHHLPRVRAYFIKHAPCPVRYLFENVVMDEGAIVEANHIIGSNAVRIDAGKVCAADRSRLYWSDCDFVPRPGESVEPGRHYTRVILEEDPSRLNILDNGWAFHDNFSGTLRCITGWRRRDRPPPMPRGIERASNEAKTRWRCHDFATPVYNFEDNNLAWPTARRSTQEPRILNIRELERTYGYPANYTALVTRGTNDGANHDDKRRDAIGNGYAIPVVARQPLS
jgi:site-specific DNA-cytosine methylase